MPLRYYQEEAIQAVFDYWQNKSGNPLVDMATGTGKAMTIAELNRRLLQGWPDMRVLNVTHVVELVEANFKELLGIWPFAPVGVYAASMGMRDSYSQIIYAQLQTVWSKAARIGHVDVLIIDEVHLVPKDADTMYGKFIAALLKINPDMKIVGFSATVYRLDSGRLDEGDDRLFDEVVYEYGIARGIEDGYLAPLSSKPTATTFDLTGVGTLGGDYKKGQLAAAVDKEEATELAVAEAIAKGADRRSALFFCCGVDHATHVRDAIRRHGRTAEMVTGNTSKEDRRAFIEGIRNGTIWALTNDSVLTTGTNIVGVDLIADLAPTKSTSRYVQKGGRGTRPIYAPGYPLDTPEQRRAAIAASVKPNCLYLDYAGNVSYHGPIDAVMPRKPGSGQGDAPVKICPNCEEINHASVRECKSCGYHFPENTDAKHATTADVAPILSTAEPEWHPVSGRTYREHHKPGMPPSVKVTYMVGLRAQNEWLGPGHGGFMKAKSDKHWKSHGGKLPFPKTADEFLDRVGELKVTAEIQLKPNPSNKKYMDVIGWRAGEDMDPTPAERAPANDNQRWAWAAGDDEIPF